MMASRANRLEQPSLVTACLGFRVSINHDYSCAEVRLQISAAIEALDPGHLCAAYWDGKAQRQAAAAGLLLDRQHRGASGGGGGRRLQPKRRGRCASRGFLSGFTVEGSSGKRFKPQSQPFRIC